MVMFAKNDPAEQIKRKVMRRHVTGMGDRRGAYRVLVVKPEGERPLGRPGRKWETYQYGSSRYLLGRRGLD